MSDFDKNIKIPEIKINTGKITAAVTKANEVMSDFLNNNPFSEFDRIANDIRDRVDNAIAMEFTKYIGELLRKNGVVPKITEYTRDFETDNTFETRYGVSIDELDFSEHDKVFEDKIEELDRKRKIWIDKAVKWQQESEKLKKQIAELESKEDEKPTKYITVIVAKEINGQEYVRLEDFMSVVNDLQAQIGT